MTLTHPHDLGCLGDGKLVFQNTVENLNPCLFLLVQCYIPHGDDIFADQLAGDRIVEHQHLDGSFITSKESPSDFDGCWDPDGVTLDQLDSVLRAFRNRRAAQKAKYKGELYRT